MTPLADEKCAACRADAPRVSPDDAGALLRQIQGWRIVEKDGIPRLEKAFAFPDFATALAFSVRLGEVADKEDHHPALLTEWGRVTVSWWTHKIQGLHRNDFVMAAKTDALSGEPKR